ncbi:hypothetical protein E0485_06670 [Paenibacillus albiflavus]|uniref:SLH domain-containing protein n=1 Tax=Paenibacillus albiflavus TaxID=2545760 RepID=A0A4R4EGM2_9BACL|nr:S8 family serine peptidase [Paenibacillus albiflavus]TCZ78757.1 hypothetical protein E0485_06670 [Paenibacillus albiflavus]
MKRKLFKRVSAFALALSLLGYGGLYSGSIAQASTISELQLQKTNLSAINKLLNTQLAKSDPQQVFISPQINTGSSDEIRIIVQMQSEPLAASNYASKMGLRSFAGTTEASIKNEQTTFMKQASLNGINIKKNYEYTNVFNGMEVTVPANQVPQLAQLPGVKAIHVNHTYYEIPLQDGTSLDAASPNYEALPLQQIGVDYAWSQGYTGKGLKVGVIDTGVDYTHPDLKKAFKGGYDSYFNTDDPYEEPPAGKDFLGTSHGTHVSGTIVGRAKNPTSDIVQKGIAYESDLYVYKVLGFNVKSGRAEGTTAQVLDGIERAVKDGMDVLNLSLGSDDEKDPNSPEAIALNNAVLSGITVVVANGNAGPSYYSMGSPASSLLSISVGAVTSPSNHYAVSATSTLTTEPPVVPNTDPDPAAESEDSTLSNEPTPSPEDSTPPSEEPVSASEETPTLSIEPSDSPDGSTLPSEEPVSTPEETPTLSNEPSDSPDETLAPSNEPSSPPVTTSDALTAEPANHVFNMMAWETGRNNFASILGPDPIETIYVGIGDEPDYAGVDVTDKVVLASRGTLAFVDKIAIAKEHGAKAIIIFNGNVIAGTSNPDLSESVSGRDGAIGSVAYLGDSFDYIPTFDMVGTEGRKLAKQVISTPGSKLTFTFDENYELTVVPGDSMADFSSRGPESDDKLSIKPDFSAPGVNILSTVPAYGKSDPSISYDQAYARKSGTSMATPHVAGLTLLLKQAHPDWLPFDIRAALGNTADQISDEKGTLYDVYSQGAGRVNIKNALQTPALLQSIEELTILDKNLDPQVVTNYGDNTSFGVMAPGTVQTNILQLKNTSANPVSYHASVRMHPIVTSNQTPDVSNIIATLDNVGADNTITVGGNSSEVFSLTVSPTAAAVKGTYEGEVLLESSGLPSLHLPFAVYVGTELPDNGFGLQEFELDKTSIFIDGDDEALNDIAASFKLTAGDVNYILVEVDDLNNETLGYYGEMFNNFKIIPKGNYGFQFDNEYEDDDGEMQKLPEGMYQIAVIGLQLNEAGHVVVRPDGTKIQYLTIKTFAVKMTEQDRVNKAQKMFTPNITNTTILGEPVLTLPTTKGVTYKVTESNKPDLIDNDGTLLALPETNPTSVDLTVTITSNADPEIYATTNVKVPLLDPDTIELQKVTDAKNSFVPNITNKTIINKPVLTLPTTKGVTYEVTGSNNTALINNSGTLLALPEKDAASVDLTVTIASVAKPSISATTNVTVTLNPPPVDPDAVELQKVTDAKNNFVLNVSNTTTLNAAVLTLPSTDGITYQVTGSNNTAYISNNGILQSRPNSGTAAVELTITIASAAKPSIKLDVKGSVTLTAPSDNNSGGPSTGGGGSSYGGSSTPASTPAINSSSSALLAKGQATTNLGVKTVKSGQSVNGTLSDADLKTALNKNPNSPSVFIVNIPVTGSQQAELLLTPAQVTMLANSNAGNTLLITIGNASIAIPVTIFKSVPAGLSVSLTLGSASDQSSAFTNFSGAKVLGTPYHYEMNLVNGKDIKPFEPSNQIFIKRSFTINGKVDSSASGVLYQENNAISGLSGTFINNTDGTTTVVANRPGFSVYAAATHQINFTDISDSWAKARIQALANKFLISGTSATTFSPKQNVTRAEFAAMLTRALGLHASNASPFKDVKATDWYANSIAAAYEAGLISGIGNDLFDPNSLISRQDLSVILSKALKLLHVTSTTSSKLEAYADASEASAYAQSSIEAVTALNLMDIQHSDGSSMFNPLDAASREASASAIFLLLQQAGLIN